MFMRTLPLLIAVSLVAACSQPPAPASETPQPPPPAAETPAPAVGPVTPPSTDEERIKSAMSAGPEEVSKDATIVAMELFAILENAGAQVLGPAASVERAMALAVANKIDCAVLDVNLNGEMVFSVAQKLRDDDVPFIFVTGYGDPSMWPPDFRDAERLSKPVQGAELLAIVVALIRNRTGEQREEGTR